MSTPEDEVNSLLQQVADEHGLELSTAVPNAGRSVPAAGAAVSSQDELSVRLANLKG